MSSSRALIYHRLLLSHQNLQSYLRKHVETQRRFITGGNHSVGSAAIHNFYISKLCNVSHPSISSTSNRSHLRQKRSILGNIFIQKRDYIFFPTSFAEFMKILRDTVVPFTKISSPETSSNKLFVRLRRSKDQVLVKVQRATQGLNKFRTSVIQRSRTLQYKQQQQQQQQNQQIAVSTVDSTLFNRFSQWKGLKKQRVRDWVQVPLQQKVLAMKKKAQLSIMGKLKALSNKESLSSNWKQTYYSLLRKSLATHNSSPPTVTDTTIMRDAIKPSSSYYKRKFMALRILLSNPKLILYSQQLFTLSEPFEPSWFDEDGYPLTSQDPHTLRYVNPWMSSSSNGWKSLKDVWKWKKNRVVDMRTTPSQDASIKLEIPRPIPLERIDTSPPKDNEQKIKLTWIGHSTCLVHMSNQFTILTDPIFSEKASPFQKFGKKEFFGVSRYFPPAISLWDSKSVESSTSLPQLPSTIDICLISHDHYDHLDYSSVVNLVDRVKIWVVPLGIKQWLLDNIHNIDPSSIVELKWWDDVTLTRMDASDAIVPVHKRDGDMQGKSYITLTCTPAQHWCSRTPLDRNTRLWCSWAVHACFPMEKSMKKLGFFFAGDTARPDIFPLHRQIGDRLGPFDLAAIPIGAYAPRFFMKDSHCDPDEAVQISHDLGSRKSVAIHWGTFPLADESYWDPPIRLHEAARNFERVLPIEKMDFTAIGHGDSIEAMGQDEYIDTFRDLKCPESKQSLEEILLQTLDKPIISN